jgi:D-alanyl-D-alanine carboxypeptidase
MTKKHIFYSIFLLITIFCTVFSLTGESTELSIRAVSYGDLGYSNEDLERLTYYYTTDILDVIKKLDIPRYFTFQAIKFKNFMPDRLGLYFEKSGGTIRDLLYMINTVNRPNLVKESTVKEPALFKGTSTILVNKNYYLDKDYVPKDLVEISIIPYIKRPHETMALSREAYEHYLNLYEQAKELNLSLVIFSGFRTYEKQSLLYYSIYKQDDNYVARPGFSEHQTGLAVDVSSLDSGLADNFEKTPEFAFLKQNAHTEGFILRYPQYKEKVTGYYYEPWHFRYVGISIATTIHQEGITYEEYIAKYVETPLS